MNLKFFFHIYSFREEQIFREYFIERPFYDFFILRTSGVDDKTLYFQKEEVQAVKFGDLSIMQKMIEKHELVERDEIYQVLKNFLFLHLAIFLRNVLIINCPILNRVFNCFFIF